MQNYSEQSFQVIMMQNLSEERGKVIGKRHASSFFSLSQNEKAHVSLILKGSEDRFQEEKITKKVGFITPFVSRLHVQNAKCCFLVLCLCKT